MRNYNAGLLFLLKRSQEAHSRSTQRLRSFEQEQKDKLESNVIEFSFLSMSGILKLKRGVLFLGLLIFVHTVLPVSGSPRAQSVLERIKEKGQLTVVTRNSPTTYYIGPQGPMGFEYHLAKAFAESLGVSLRIVLPTRFNQILPRVANGEADLAAAGITVTESRRVLVKFGPSYQQITQQLLYRAGRRRPRTIDELVSGKLEVVAGTSHVERLNELKKEHANLSWAEHKDLESEELMQHVWQNTLDFTIADSNEITLNRRYYPEVRVAFDISGPQSLAWAFSKGSDNSLYNAAAEFFTEIENNGVLKQIKDRYYGHAPHLNYVSTRVFMKHIKERLPLYRELFNQAATKMDLDWRLLAAMGYQESMWNPKATSPTGVRGLMMLTRVTAHQIGIDDRGDPAQSIDGGAKYFKLVKHKIPLRIPEPDRTWLTLAAYNIGFGHLEDARVLTQSQGGDPDKWLDVEQRLPLLSQRKWHLKTKHGYARGHEPVTYVRNIRNYYDILTWTLRKETLQAASASAHLSRMFSQGTTPSLVGLPGE